MSWCFQCQTEYAEDVVECVECGVELVAEAPTELDDVGGSDEEQIVYELHEWTGESRRALDQELTGQNIAHSWLGATLVIRAADEESVDEIQESDSLLVPLDAWNTVLNQLGNLHESSQLMAEARERAAKAEAEVTAEAKVFAQGSEFTWMPSLQMHERAPKCVRQHGQMQLPLENMHMGK